MVIIVIVIFVIILNRLGVTGVVGDGVVKVDDILLVILVRCVWGHTPVVGDGVVKVCDILLEIIVIALLVRWVWGLLTSQPGVSPGAGNTVHTKDAVEVANYLGLEMDGALDSALGDTLDGLLDAADSADIVAQEGHPGYLDVAERDSHFVDEIQVNKVDIAVW